MDQEINASATDGSAAPRVRGTLAAALIVMACQGVFYVAWRSAIDADLFGGDLVNVSLGHWDSLALGRRHVRDMSQLAAKLLAGRDAPADTIPAVAYRRLARQGRELLEPLAASRGSQLQQDQFLLELNRSVCDAAIDWPDQALAALHLPPTPPADVPTAQYNAQVLAAAMPKTLVPSTWRLSWSDLQTQLPRVAAYYFTQTQPTRYSPLTNVFVHMVNLFCKDAPDRIAAAIWLMGGLYGLMMAMVFILAADALRSLLWAAAAMLLFQFTLSAITMSYLLFALPYLFVPMAMAASLGCYARYKSTGHWPWLIGFVAASIAGPWFREFPGAVPFVAALCEAVTFRKWRSAVILGLCLPLMVHSVYPSLLPHVLGFNPGKVYGVFEQANTVAQSSTAHLQWHMFIRMLLQFPPVLWLLTIAAVGHWLWRASRRPAPAWIKSPGRRLWRLLPLIAAAALAVAVGLCAFYIRRQGEWTVGVARTVTILGLVFMLLSLRFGVLLPAYMILVFPVFLKVTLAEVHLAFVLFPLAIIVVLWLRDLFVELARRPLTPLRRAALAGALLVLAVAGVDHALNLRAAVTTQRELSRANREMGAWIAGNLDRHPIIVCNFYNMTDVYHHAGYRFDPFESKANCPMGPGKVVDDCDKLRRMVQAWLGHRRVYFLAAEQDFRPTHVRWDSHQFVRNPPGRLIPLADFHARNRYVYADPLRYFLPRELVSFPGYMDWSDDYYCNNLPRPFQRIVYADYTIYRLEELWPATKPD
ncbi:MAG: hypothetical protein LLG01_16160 [Planctomycetaceae bacterium]|nr:hypothetical protein [Planctomycetaceae bacterium]